MQYQTRMIPEKVIARVPCSRCSDPAVDETSEEVVGEAIEGGMDGGGEGEGKVSSTVFLLSLPSLSSPPTTSSPFRSIYTLSFSLYCILTFKMVRSRKSKSSKKKPSSQLVSLPTEVRLLPTVLLSLLLCRVAHLCRLAGSSKYRTALERS